MLGVKPLQQSLQLRKLILFCALQVLDACLHYTQQAILIDSGHSQDKHIMLEHHCGIVVSSKSIYPRWIYPSGADARISEVPVLSLVSTFMHSLACTFTLYVNIADHNIVLTAVYIHNYFRLSLSPMKPITTPTPNPLSVLIKLLH